MSRRLSKQRAVGPAPELLEEPDAGLVSPLYNPYAAMPSMHAGYALVVGATLLHQGRYLVTRARRGGHA
jgi:PAP2 superfamily protein